MNLNQMVMQAKRLEVWTCTRDASLREVAGRMVSEDISSLVVVDEDEYLAGIITRTDLLRARLDAGLDWKDLLVEAYMSQDVITVPSTATLVEVSHLLLDRHIHRVVVVRSEGERLRPLSVISSADLLYHMVKKM